ncbi:MAG TPA: YkgJ family cysteine cluster protein [Methanothrix soehngenii]|jgi:Fe-S-cluster containining protein|uniref:YkgJ family cysteine cluster protein n=1 Tax=Methanothrix soehngenii TaxID=2223 RepID=UPI002C76174F|nr:YkgJ family cysteine cluster protein [Methanothrix soehngenii]HOE46390.1 YkgJ family cysteine cluster protein [Methanothrix soehngenii]HOI20054.1 YkgJ family cysteine cluster protein [Methanothrix soehngenii]HOS23208.1 YkgJ family cysteine cluster protein [Methanothrix soehngenii]HPL21419.1 YkgJ family cysteine cluster protein [Methanothrix soehngenii]
MDEDLCQTLSRACDDCHLAGGCCFEARPPLSQKRIDILMENGVSADAIEFVGYKRLRLRQDGFCVLFRDGKCSIHDIKPETCVAGPFTFDIKGDMLQIFLKRESICPMVRFLRANRKAYDALFETSVEKIMDLIRSVPEEEMAQILQIDEPQTDLVAEIRLED